MSKPTSLPLTAAVTVQHVASYLRTNGVKVIDVVDDDDVVDGEITLSDTLSVQVGIGYAMLNLMENDDLFTMGKQRFDARDLLTDIRDHMKSSLRIVTE